MFSGAAWNRRHNASPDIEGLVEKLEELPLGDSVRGTTINLCDAIAIVREFYAGDKPC